MAESDGVPEEFIPDARRVLGLTGAQLRLFDEQNYENALVALLFARYNLPRKIKFEMLDEMKFGGESPRLTLAAFCRRFSNFPVYLVAKKFRTVSASCPVSRLFSDFRRRCFTQEFYSLQENLDEAEVAGRALGLIFDWPHLPGGKAKGLVLHDRVPDNESAGVRMTWVGEDEERLTLEPLSVFLKSVDADYDSAWRNP